MDLTPSRLDELVADFERGWSQERIDAADATWGPGLIEVLPPDLAARLQDRARRSGVSQMHVVRDALTAYLRSA